MDEIYARMNDDAEVEELVLDEPSRIQDFFAGQTIFLTGCTGFMGKLLVEKLLRSCPDVRRLYLMVRPKKQSTSERMKAYFKNVIFDVLKKERHDYQEVVSIVEGDLSKEAMGLSEKDRVTLTEEATIIYHNASNVKFDERMSIAMRVNVYGTRYMLDLANDCKNLVAFFYVSTAYSHCYNREIEEDFCPPPGDMKMMKDILEADAATVDGLDEEVLKDIRGKWPNNYAFTKSMAEYLVEECAGRVTFACGVYRPSIVVSTFLEPIRAWSGNINGPVSVMIGTGIGFLHAIYCPNLPIDLVPADMATNALLAATWDAVTNKEAENRAIVYNYGSTTVNPITMKEMGEESFKRGISAPSINTMNKYYAFYVDTRWQYWLIHLTFHLLPALIVDFLLICAREKPKVFSYWKLLTKNLDALFLFTSGNWRIKVPRMKALWSRMNRRDSQLFFCDLRELDWIEYCYAYWLGLRVYLLKEPLDNMMVARARYEKTKKIHDVLSCLTVAAILYYAGGWLFSVTVAAILQ